MHARLCCCFHTRCYGNLGIYWLQRLLCKDTSVACYVYDFSKWHVAIAFAQAMHQIGADQTRRDEHKAACSVASCALEEEEDGHLKGPERQFARLDCWQACMNGGSHNDGQNCQNDNDTHSGC